MNSSAIESELLRRCNQARVEALWQFARHQRGGERRIFPDGGMVRCDVPADAANILYLCEPHPPYEGRLREAAEFFGPKVPWRIMVSGGHSDEIGELAVRRGLRVRPSEPCMVLDPIPDPPPSPSNLSIRTVTSSSELADFGIPWCKGFGIPSMAFPIVFREVPPDDPVQETTIRLFVGYEAGAPVACSAVAVYRGVGEIGSVAVVPASRRRGYGEALTWRAAFAAREAGARIASLEATAMGFPVYAKMGFRRVCDINIWAVHWGFFRTLGALRTLRKLADWRPPRA